MKIAVIGAGASGLFCAALLGQKGHEVTIIDKNPSPAAKLLLTGGGKCNFTNLHVSAANYISGNPHFCKSAISRFTPYDFIDLMRKHKISFHEREHGQLFCDNAASDILDMLLAECAAGGVKFIRNNELTDISKAANGFQLSLSAGKLNADRVIVATGGLSIPKIGVSPIGYRIAEKFGIPVAPVRAGLVPLTFDGALMEAFNSLSGISIQASVRSECGAKFEEKLLFTHRGLSGPAILQISNYWKPGEHIFLDLLPNFDIESFIIKETIGKPRKQLTTTLSQLLPKKLADSLRDLGAIPDISLDRLTIQARSELANNLHSWKIKPNGTEGYRTAEVTLGGVSANHISSKTMEASVVRGLYFIGEVIDVTGWLGGYNLQWCWSSAWACAENMG